MLPMKVSYVSTAFAVIASKEARREVGVFHDMFTEADDSLTAARASIGQLKAELVKLRASFKDLNVTHNWAQLRKTLSIK